MSAIEGKPPASTVILLRVPQNSANQLDHPRGNSQEESDYADPRSMQPPVERRPPPPSHNRASRQHKGELTVAPDLHPRICFLLGASVVGWSGRWHDSS